MRFDSVRTKNYRQYQDVNFDFTKSLETDLHIIQASNGVGKTNLLNAINWCLYGDEPHMSTDENKLSICTEKVLKEAKAAGEEVCEVEVVIKGTVEGKEKTSLTITRRVKVNSSTGNAASKDELVIEELQPSGSTEIMDKEKARLRIEEIFPMGIREYFFFDGEQLLNYFGEKTNTSAIKDSIYRIAQIDSIREAHSHLEEIIKKYNKDIGDAQPKLREVLHKKDDAENAKKNKLAEIMQLELQIRHSKERIQELDGLIVGSKDAVEANTIRNRNLRKIEGLRLEREGVLNQLKELVRKYTILLYLYPSFKKALAYIQEKEEEGVINTNIDIDIIRRCLEQDHCVVCDEDLTEQAREHLEELERNVKTSSTATKMFATMRAELQRAMNDALNYQKEKEILVQKYNHLTDEIDELEEENERKSEIIKKCSDIKNAESMMLEKEDHEDAMQANLQKLGKYKQSLEDIDKRIKELENEYRQLESEAKVDEELKKCRDFAMEAMSIIVSIETEMASDVKTRMEHETMSIFDELIWKKNTYSHVELDHNFRFQLFNNDGKSCFGTCSAAEKELLALAFTIALHKVSGYNNLLFIDTPVGRVSDINRSNFASVLKDISRNKQIILAFTPSEYSDEIKAVMNDTVVSSFNYLTSDEASTERS